MTERQQRTMETYNFYLRVQIFIYKINLQLENYVDHAVWTESPEQKVQTDTLIMRRSRKPRLEDIHRHVRRTHCRQLIRKLKTNILTKYQIPLEIK